MQRGPGILTFHSWKIMHWSWLKCNCISTTHSRIQDGLMPHRTWRLQQQRICVEGLPSARTEIPRIKQPPQTPCSCHYALGGHHSGKTLPWQMHPFHDQQHNIGRLAQETQLHQWRQRPNPSNNITWSSSSPCLPLPLARNLGVQPMVLWHWKHSCQCPLSRRWPVRQRTNKNPLLLLPFPASQALQYSTPSQKNYLLADLTAALVACQTTVSGHWRRAQLMVNNT